MDMNDEILEQPETTQVVESSKLLGKFDNVDALAKAYESLQADYTRKSQELAGIKLQQESASVAVNKSPIVEEVSRDEIIKEYLTNVAKAQTAPVVITATSDVTFGVKSEPRSLRDIQNVAEIFFKTKGEQKL